MNVTDKKKRRYFTNYEVRIDYLISGRSTIASNKIKYRHKVKKYLHWKKRQHYNLHYVEECYEDKLLQMTYGKNVIVHCDFIIDTNHNIVASRLNITRFQKILSSS